MNHPPETSVYTVLNLFDPSGRQERPSYASPVAGYFTPALFSGLKGNPGPKNRLLTAGNFASAASLLRTIEAEEENEEKYW